MYFELEKETLHSKFFRKVIHTTNSLQLVLMSLKPLENIGMETHKDVDQFIRVEQGFALATVDHKFYELKAGDSIIIPAGSEHDIINTSEKHRLQLYTLYSPPQHKVGTIVVQKPI